MFDPLITCANQTLRQLRQAASTLSRISKRTEQITKLLINYGVNYLEVKVLSLNNSFN